MGKLARRSVVGVTVLVLGAFGTVVPAFADGGSGYHHERGTTKTLLQSPLIGSLTTDASLFGVAPGGVDWTVSRSKVTVKTNGRVDVKVRDLLVTSTGVNPVPQISLSLFCNGTRSDTVGPFAIDAMGDARIKDTFDVPARCLAPAVLVNPLDRVGTYIAASGVAR